MEKLKNSQPLVLLSPDTEFKCLISKKPQCFSLRLINLVFFFIQYFLHTEDRYSSRHALMCLNFLLSLGSLPLLRKNKFYIPQIKISFIFSSKWFLNCFIFFCNMHLSWLYTETLMHHIYGPLFLMTVHTVLYLYKQNAITVKTGFFSCISKKNTRPKV